MASKPKRKLVREIVRYRCQFCGREAAAKRWTLGGTRCPNCQSDYDARLAQDEETD